MTQYTMRGKKSRNQNQDFVYQKKCKILSYTHQTTANIPNVFFPYADINNNLKLLLQENFNNKNIFTFKSKAELHSLFEKFDWELPVNN